MLKLILAALVWTGFVFKADAQTFSGGSLSVSGTYTGSTLVDSGTVTLNAGTLTGTNTYTGSGTLTVNGNTGLVIGSGDYTLTGSTLDFNLNGSAGATTTGGSLTVTGVSTNSGFTTTLGSTIGGTIDFGGSTFDPTGVGTVLTISGGSGTINGTGISTGGTLTVTAGGTMTVTNPTTLSGSIDFSSPGSLQMYFNTATDAADTLSINGNLGLDDTNLTVTDLSDPGEPVPVGTTFTLVHYTGTETGEFVVDGSPVPQGGDVAIGKNEFTVNYAEGDPNVTLTAVISTPEPDAWLLLLVGGGFLGLWRRFARVRRS